MEITVNSKELSRNLALVCGCVEKKTTIPILSNVLLETKDGALSICGTDLEQTITVRCPATVSKVGSITIPGKRLQEYIGLLPDGEVSMKATPNHWVSIQCGPSKTKMAGMSPESYPELPKMPKSLATLPAKALVALIGRTAFCIASEGTRFTMNGALAEFNGSMKMVATDGHRMALTEQTLVGSDIDFKGLFPVKAMAQLPKFLDGAESFDLAEDGNGYFFATPDRTLYSRRMTGNFPDYSRVMPQGAQISLVMKKDELVGAVGRVIRFANETSRLVRLDLSSEGGLKLSSAVFESGESEEMVPAEYSGDPLTVGFNGQYIMDFLRTVPQSEVRLLLKDGNSAGELQPVYPDGTNKGASYRYVVMPMRLS